MKRNSKRNSPKKSNRKSPKKSNRKSPRNRNFKRRNCRYSGSLSRFEKPYCEEGWEYVDDEELFKQGKILSKLPPNEKLCKQKNSDLLVVISKNWPEHRFERWLNDKPRDRAGYDKDGFNYFGYNRDGFNKAGFDLYGHDKDGYDKDGYDINWFNKNGINKYTKTKYNRNGYDKKAFDEIKRNEYCEKNPNDKNVPTNGISCVDYCAKPDSDCVKP